MLFCEVILPDPLTDTTENRKALLGLFASEASSLNIKIVMAKVIQSQLDSEPRSVILRVVPLGIFIEEKI